MVSSMGSFGCISFSRTPHAFSKSTPAIATAHTIERHRRFTLSTPRILCLSGSRPQSISHNYTKDDAPNHVGNSHRPEYLAFASMPGSPRMTRWAIRCTPLIGHLFGRLCKILVRTAKRDEPVRRPVPLAFSWEQSPLYLNEGDRASRGRLCSQSRIAAQGASQVA